MLRRLYAQFPDFARPNHPIMRYMMLREGRKSTRNMQLLRAIGMVGVLVFLLIAGWLIATNFGRAPLATPNPLDGVYQVFYWPLVILQLLMRVFALSTTVGMIAFEIRHGTWDTLKITTDGAMLTMRARWAIAFYRVWLLLLVLVIARVFFIIVALVNLSTFQGRYLDLLLSGTIPLGQPGFASADVMAFMGTLILALMMTASLLAPFTAIAFDAALGMFIASLLRRRVPGILGQFGLVIGRILLTAWALWVSAAALSLNPFTGASLSSAAPGANPITAWLGALAGITEGDLGLTLLHLPNVGRLWAELDYGVLVGVGCLVYVLLQAALANALVRWAGRRAVVADSV